MKRRGRRDWIVRAAALVLLALTAFSVYYVSDYYHADAGVREYLAGSETVAVVQIPQGLFLDGPGTETALVFYPGGKVEYTAYAPLLFALAEDGVDCFLVQMPVNLAIFGKNKAADILAAYDYAHWYLGGHSLGGAMAANWAAENPGALEGLLLLAAYPSKALPEDLRVLELYGSEDGVLSRRSLSESEQYLPANARAEELPGGNHAQFGDYGAQKGDGEAAISRETQTAWAVETIEAWIGLR